MNWRTECAAVIPCLNEAGSIQSVIRAVRNHVDTVIVVDDGSADSTATLAAQAGAEVHRHDATQGKGAALLTGCERAKQHRFKWVLTLDGDGQHAAEDIPRFFAAAETDGAALVSGNRMGMASQMPWLRRQVNRWMSRRLSRLAGTPLPDSQCGFRLMRLDAWSSLPLRTRHFEVESEVLLAFVRAGWRVDFVPVRAIYKDEQSKIHPWHDTVRWFRWWRQVRQRQAPKDRP